MKEKNNAAGSIAEHLKLITVALTKSDFAPKGLQQGLEAAILGLLTLSVYLFTTNPITKPFALYIYVSSLFLLAIFFIIQVKHDGSFATAQISRTIKIIVFATVTGVFLWISNTGWFLSPFFYLLYLVGISLGFLFSPSVALSFVLLLIGVLLPSIGSVDSKLDAASLLALLCIVPLSYFLRREYVKRIAREKKILILSEENQQFKNKVDEVLSNKITKIAVELREPLNDIRQIALYSEKHTMTQKKRDVAEIVNSSVRALDLLKTFEEETTGKKLAKTPKN